MYFEKNFKFILTSAFRIASTCKWSVGKTFRMDDTRSGEAISACYSATFRSVLQRLIDLTSNDLRDLENMLNVKDPWTLVDQTKERTMKRERCLKLLCVLQEAMETENKRGLNSKDSGNEDENKRIEKEIAIARSKTSDKIMIMLNYF